MHFPRKVVVFLLLAAPLFTLTACKKILTPPALDPGSVTILCLGDSITAGTHGDGDSGQLSYPGILAGLLEKARNEVQVVNEGQNGWMVNDVSQHIADWLQPVAPNIILLQIGTNDLEQGATPTEAAWRLDILITQIQNLAPQAHLYVADCTPVRSDNKPKLSLVTLEQFNEMVPKVVRDHERLGHSIEFVDLYKRADLNDADFGPDGEHPDDSGYEKMAVYWSFVLHRHEGSSL